MTTRDELTIERQRIVSQISELRRSEREIRKSLDTHYVPALDSLITVYDRRQALTEYLRQIDSDLAALRMF